MGLEPVVRDGDAVVAGVSGWTWSGCSEMQYLWVDEDRRGEGLGSTLITAFEDEATRQGCRQVFLFTHASQAPELYESRGGLVGALDDCPSGDRLLWYCKALSG